MAISSLTSSLSVQAAWNAVNAITGLSEGVGNSNTVTKRSSLGTAAAAAAAGGANQVASWIQTISASGSASIDLTSVTNALQQTAVSLARVKAVFIQLLSVADDADIGTAATHVEVGNAASNCWASQSDKGWMKTVTQNLEDVNGVFVIPSGGFLAFGTDNAAGVAVDSTHKVLKIANGDGAVTAKVRVTLIGSDA